MSVDRKIDPASRTGQINIFTLELAEVREALLVTLE
jgi:hypothetical protein